MKVFSLSLPSADVFQMLDALDSRASSYAYTARYLAGIPDAGEDDYCVVEECSSAEEAAAIGKHFRDIAASIRGQIERQ